MARPSRSKPRQQPLPAGVTFNVIAACFIVGSIGFAWAWVVHRKNSRGRDSATATHDIEILHKEIDALRKKRDTDSNDATLKQRVADLGLDLVSAPTDKLKVLSAAVPARAVPTP